MKKNQNWNTWWIKYKAKTKHKDLHFIELFYTKDFKCVTSFGSQNNSKWQVLACMLYRILKNPKWAEDKTILNYFS
jgi:hypothetical protein